MYEGGLRDPVDGTVLLFRGDSPKVVQDFANSDPYVVNGLVSAWRVREWTTVIGDLAEVELPPFNRVAEQTPGDRQ